MQLEKQVVSLELAKRLKELGVKQESLFYWSVSLPETAKSKSEVALLKDIEPMLTQQEWGEGFTSYSAFTVAELGEMLPFHYELGEAHVGEAMSNEGEWGLWFYPIGLEDDRLKRVEAETEADSRAKMLVYLLEQGLIKDSKK